MLEDATSWVNSNNLDEQYNFQGNVLLCEVLQDRLLSTEISDIIMRLLAMGDIKSGCLKFA